MAVWRGVPLQSAIIVRHTPREYGRSLGRKDTGAMAVSGNAKALSYVTRTDDFRDKSDIDRSPTRMDMDMTEERDAADRLEYAGRAGDYSEKGAARQVDASLWDAHGPIGIEEARELMRADGGAFIDSIVAVDRDHAPALHLETKEDMQRLLRATWSENVEKWGLIERPEDIRWVAAYHTDADQSVHCHVLTWSARGEIEPGATVPREGTRLGKEAIYRMGYASVREERDERSNFLRDLARQQASRLVGATVDRKVERSLAERAQRCGYRERPLSASDMPPESKAHLHSLQDKLREELRTGSGSLSRNYPAQATARDIMSALKRDSPSFSRTCSEYDRCSEVKADLKGYPRDSHDRERLARDDREELAKRTSSAIVRAHLPEDARERYREGRNAWREASEGRDPAAAKERYEEYQRAARERRERRNRAEQSRRESQGRLSDSDLARQNDAASRFGTSVDRVSRMGRSMAQVARATGYGARQGITWEAASPAAHAAARSFAREALRTEAGRRVIDRAVAGRMGRDPSLSAEDARRDVTSHAVDRMARNVFEAGRVGNLGQEPSNGRDNPAISALGGVSASAGLLEGIARASAAGTANLSRGAGHNGHGRTPQRDDQRFHEEGRDRL